jgi:hypothetical protein
MKLEVTKNTDAKVCYSLEWFNGAESVRKIQLYEESFKALEEYFRPKVVRKTKQPAPAPTLEEVKDYFKEKGYSEEGATKMHDYYTSMEWMDANKKPVLNWKAKSIAVWFKKEYKIQQVKQENKPSFFQ